MEILLVLIILAGAGFSLLIRIPHDFEKKNIEISATELQEDLRETQQAAISNNVWYQVKFSPYTNEYKIFKQSELVSLQSLPTGVRFSNSPSELTFLPTGAPNVGMTVILKAGNLERKIIVAPVLGRIRLE